MKEVLLIEKEMVFLFLLYFHAQVFFRECCKIFKNIYVEEHLQTAASELMKLHVECRGY